MKETLSVEANRQVMQRELDLQKTQEQRNILGQFSTPIALANDILQHAYTLIPEKKNVRFLDPAFGTGAFYSALTHVFAPDRIEAAVGYEIDEHYGIPSRIFWGNSRLNYHLADFTKVAPPPIESQKFNLIVCNPPYVRHHHIGNEKARLHAEAISAANMNLSSLAGLYCYFIALCNRWMEDGGIAGWLIPSEFMDVNYGQAIKDYLLTEVTLLQIHRFDAKDVQFQDALVSSAIVWFKKTKPNEAHKIKFTYGGTIEKPVHEKDINLKVLLNENKWTRFPLSNEREPSVFTKLGDYFSIKRGIATGNNKYFILSSNEIELKKLPISQFRPILPSPRYLSDAIINADSKGNPAIDGSLFVLDCKLSIDDVQRLYPTLFEYIQTGVASGVPERYLCKNRKIWYAQENRSESIFYCTYIGRSDNENKKPFRFILNHSKAIVANSYLILYPNPELTNLITREPSMAEKLLDALNNITRTAILDEGRVYGGGMHKVEPKELANVPANEIFSLIGY
jgi:hypothetical protein